MSNYDRDNVAHSTLIHSKKIDIIRNAKNGNNVG